MLAIVRRELPSRTREEGQKACSVSLMTLSAFLFQALNGLSTASGLFFIAVGLSLIFGVTRIINIAHGSLYMLGTYLAYTFATRSAGRLASGAASSRPP